MGAKSGFEKQWNPSLKILGMTTEVKTGDLVTTD